MRLFVGLILPEEIRTELFAVQKKFSSDVAKIKWISKKNLHLTLKYLGDVDKKDLKVIYDKLERIKFDPFEIRLGQLNFFKKNGQVKALWTEITPKKKVIKLQQEVDEELLSNFKFDQSFSPHLTLGRIKLIKNENKFSKILKEVKVKNKKFSIDKFYLIRSKLTKDGPNYKILKEFNK